MSEDVESNSSPLPEVPPIVAIRELIAFLIKNAADPCSARLCTILNETMNRSEDAAYHMSQMIQKLVAAGLSIAEILSLVEKSQLKNNNQDEVVEQTTGPSPETVADLQLRIQSLQADIRTKNNSSNSVNIGAALYHERTKLANEIKDIATSINTRKLEVSRLRKKISEHAKILLENQKLVRDLKEKLAKLESLGESIIKDKAASTLTEEKFQEEIRLKTVLHTKLIQKLRDLDKEISSIESSRLINQLSCSPISKHKFSASVDESKRRRDEIDCVVPGKVSPKIRLIETSQSSVTDQNVLGQRLILITKKCIERVNSFENSRTTTGALKKSGTFRRQPLYAVPIFDFDGPFIPINCLMVPSRIIQQHHWFLFKNPSSSRESNERMDHTEQSSPQKDLSNSILNTHYFDYESPLSSIRSLHRSKNDYRQLSQGVLCRFEMLGVECRDTKCTSYHLRESESLPDDELFRIQLNYLCNAVYYSFYDDKTLSSKDAVKFALGKVIDKIRELSATDELSVRAIIDQMIMRRQEILGATVVSKDKMHDFSGVFSLSKRSIVSQFTACSVEADNLVNYIIPMFYDLTSIKEGEPAIDVATKLKPNDTNKFFSSARTLLVEDLDSIDSIKAKVVLLELVKTYSSIPEIFDLFVDILVRTAKYEGGKIFVKVPVSGRLDEVISIEVSEYCKIFVKTQPRAFNCWWRLVYATPYGIERINVLTQFLSYLLSSESYDHVDNVAACMVQQLVSFYDIQKAAQWLFKLLTCQSYDVNAMNPLNTENDDDNGTHDTRLPNFLQKVGWNRYSRLCSIYLYLTTFKKFPTFMMSDTRFSFMFNKIPYSIQFNEADVPMSVGQIADLEAFLRKVLFYCLHELHHQSLGRQELITFMTNYSNFMCAYSFDHNTNSKEGLDLSPFIKCIETLFDALGETWPEIGVVLASFYRRCGSCEGRNKLLDDLIAKKCGNDSLFLNILSAFRDSFHKSSAITLSKNIIKNSEQENIIRQYEIALGLSKETCEQPRCTSVILWLNYFLVLAIHDQFEAALSPGAMREAFLNGLKTVKAPQFKALLLCELLKCYSSTVDHDSKDWCEDFGFLWKQCRPYFAEITHKLKMTLENSSSLNNIIELSEESHLYDVAFEPIYKTDFPFKIDTSKWQLISDVDVEQNDLSFATVKKLFLQLKQHPHDYDLWKSVSKSLIYFDEETQKYLKFLGNHVWGL